MVDDHIHQHTGVVAVEGSNHVAQLRLGTEAGIVLQPVNGHVAHALGRAAGIHTARIGHPHHIEVLSQFLGFAGQFTPLGGLVAVPVKALQHHTAKHRGPTLACHRRAAALAGDDTSALTEIDGQLIGSCRNAECHIHIFARLAHGNRITQHR